MSVGRRQERSEEGSLAVKTLTSHLNLQRAESDFADIYRKASFYKTKCNRMWNYIITISKLILKNSIM